MGFLYVLLAIFLFGILIFVHELGHFLTARLFHVTVLEFSIGMGPRIVWWTSKKSGTVYALRLFPIGGFVSMAGEDEKSDDENAISKKPLWQRMIITAAGSFSNLLIGFIVVGIIVFSLKNIYSPVISEFGEGAVTCAEGGLEVGDKIIKVGPRRVHTANDAVYAISRYGDEPTTVTVIRDGVKTELTVTFPTYEEQGIKFGTYDFYFEKTERNLFTLLRHTWYQSVMTVRLVWDSLFDLITGKYGFAQVSGPVGITKEIASVAQSGNKTSLLSIFSILAVNLGLMNLLPIPALDGGRLFFMFVELIFRKPVKPEIEGYIHFVGIIILLALMAVVAFKDIVYLFR